MKRPKSDLVKLCNERKYEHSLEKRKHYPLAASGITQYIVLFQLKIGARCCYYYTMFNNNHCQVLSIILQTTDKAEEKKKNSFVTSKCMLL